MLSPLEGKGRVPCSQVLVRPHHYVQFSCCKSLGRDGIRVLQSIARLPEFSAIWSDLLKNSAAAFGEEDVV